MNLNLINNWPYKWFGFWKHEGSNNSIKCDHLPSINEFIDSTWQPEYKQEIIKYLSVAPWGIASSGTERCLLCSEEVTKSEISSDGIWLWPNNLVHYITNHNIRIPTEFEIYMLHHNFIPPEKVTDEKELLW